MKAILLAAMMAIGLSASAQEKHDGKGSRSDRKPKMTAEQRAEKQTAMMDRKLDLTPAQEQDIRSANLDAARRMASVKERMMSLRKEARDIKADKREVYRKTLTVEQYRHLKAARKAHGHKRHAHRGHHWKHKRMDNHRHHHNDRARDQHNNFRDDQRERDDNKQ